ncbi:hypothetical protein GONAM_09_00780 [Gordonia namibiensis NBRC 108229]|uniref:Phospholipase A2 n=1 Tax=Gordonia namibiensis NBRC 108229 TaxID=1208314 RepID=K6X4W8_9ACTN|nr:hypothetical protein [Gordonia namibiensis]GAB99432.1 hypothetical protein GONAM_09_00780 [Gordonia namibiensis NBRC 108229]
MAALTLIVLVVGQWMSTAHAVAGDVGSSTGVVVPLPEDADNPYAAAVVALTGPVPSTMMDVLPTTFDAHMGYIPTVVSGVPVDPDGDCSSPVPLPDRFTPLCRTHDLGYDLLRAAAADGRPLGSWARFALDRMLIDSMQRSCSNPVCDAAARIARVGLAWNTWRQYGGAPTQQETIPQLVSTTVDRALVDRDPRTETDTEELS